MKLRAPLVLFAAAAAAAVFISSSAVAQVYRWVDSQGVIHYSDKPVTGAKPGQMKELKLGPPLPKQEGAPSVPPSNAEPPEAPEPAPASSPPAPAGEDGGEEPEEE